MKISYWMVTYSYYYIVVVAFENVGQVVHIVGESLFEVAGNLAYQRLVVVVVSNNHVLASVPVIFVELGLVDTLVNHFVELGFVVVDTLVGHLPFER